MPSFLQAQLAAFSRTGELYDSLRLIADSVVPSLDTNPSPVTPLEIITQLNLMSEHRTFRNCKTLKALLMYLVKTTLEPDQARPKELIIGLDVLGKDVRTFDPKLDSAVRVKMAQLRRKLDEYNLESFGSDPVLIILPRGRYQLEFKRPEQFRAERDLGLSQATLNERLFLACVQVTDTFSDQERREVETVLTKQMGGARSSGLRQLYQLTLGVLTDKSKVQPEALASSR